MKKISKILLITLASANLLLTNSVNAEDWSNTWVTSSDSEQVKMVKEDAMNKIAKAIPDNITIDIKEIDAMEIVDTENSIHNVDKILKEKIDNSLKDTGITFPINLETTDEDGNKVTITIGKPQAFVTPYYFDYDNGGMILEKNLNKAYIEANITTYYSWGGSSIGGTVKSINITYSDSSKRNDTDQKYVDAKVKEDKYLFQNVNEFDLEGSDFDPADHQKEILSRLKNLLNDDTLEFKSYYTEPMGMGDLDFGFEEWIFIVYKNGIAYKVIWVGNSNTVKITIPSTVADNEDAYFEYVSNLFANTDLGKPVSMNLLDDVNDHFGESFKFEDNKGYYEFSFKGDYEIKYAFKLVREAESKPITSVKLNKTNLSLIKGKTEKIIATINPFDTTDDKTLTWSSSNINVATVDANGNIKAIAAGTADITVKTSNGLTAIIKVTVTNPNIPITSVKINESNVNVLVNKTTKLTATINPSATTQSKTLTWTSSNIKIATVDKNGVVKGIKAGTANITVKTSNGKTATIKVTVTKPIPIKSVKLNKTKVTIELNKIYQLKATINPSNTTDDKKLTWSSSNKKVATVDNNGKITAVNSGSATITVKTSNGKKATVKVTVSKINAKKATITAIKDQIQTGISLKPALEVKLDGKVLKNGTDYTVTYKNNKNAGKATVTVKFKGNYTGSKTSSFIIIPSKVAIKNPTTAKKSITVKYIKVSGAKTYQIAYRIKGTDKWSYTTSTSASKKISKLTSGKEYEVCIRAGIKSGSKTLYGAWSDTKVIKVK